MDELSTEGVALDLGDSDYDPTDPVGQLLFNVLGMVAESEADLVRARARTREGMAIAKAAGQLRSRPIPEADGVVVMQRFHQDDGMNTRKCAGLAVLMLGAGVLAGCSLVGADDVFAEDQVDSDALPRVDSELLEPLDPASSRYLGEAEGTRYWAARNADEEFCILGQVVGGDPENMVTGCGPGDGDTLAVSLGTGPTATWSTVAGPPVPEGSTLLRDHLVVRPR